MSRQSLAVNSSGALTGTVPLATTLTVHSQGHVERAGRLGYGVLRLDFDLHLARRQLVLGPDLVRDLK